MGFGGSDLRRDAAVSLPKPAICYHHELARVCNACQEGALSTTNCIIVYKKYSVT